MSLQSMGDHDGWCPICRDETTFVIEAAWLRDHYRCQRCRSIPRQRHLQHVLDKRFPGWERRRIHESSPAYDFIRRYATKYTSSQYLPDVPWGTRSPAGVRSENLESLTFKDNRFDLVITQDVLEHVFDPAAVISEVMRVLRPGGAHVFTAPKHRGLDQTVQRARLDANGHVEHLLEPAYHGNPVGDGKSLVTFDYGYDFEQLLSEWAGTSVATYHTRDRHMGLIAEYNEVFVITKPGAPWQRPPRPRPAKVVQPPPSLGRRVARRARAEARRLFS